MKSLGWDDIRTNAERVLEKIDRAARSVDRKPEQVKLIVVTKGHPVDIVREAVAAGLHVFGENYTDEGSAKILAFSEKAGLEWHMIGHIQSRKVKKVCEYFDYVHSLDSLKLADRLDRAAAEMKRKLPVLLECNVSGEESKFGWPAWQEDLWPGLLEEVAQVVALSNLEIHGLMTMAPYLPDSELARPYFQRLNRLQAFFTERLPETNWCELSMGMSADFETAIEEGATMVRIGTAIMGPRPQSVESLV
jgi:pyridoxal phosphate enzyme (YggS family)